MRSAPLSSGVSSGLGIVTSAMAIPESLHQHGSGRQLMILIFQFLRYQVKNGAGCKSLHDEIEQAQTGRCQTQSGGTKRFQPGPIELGLSISPVHWSTPQYLMKKRS